jgi:catechol 2,3-dioxygenase-like lactoylglutathione lyase family enzyme
MIAHISIGVSDIGKSKRFYDATLEPLGYRCIRAARAATGYGYGAETIAFWVLFAEHPVAPDEQSGFHVCFAASSAAAVDAFHAAALRSGGRDNGRPGLRPEYALDYYAAFVVDPDGYRSRPISVREKRKRRTADAPVYSYYGSNWSATETSQTFRVQGSWMTQDIAQFLLREGLGRAPN